MKPWLLRLHRWLALAFSIPLAIVIATGLVLSFEPSLVTAAIKPGSLTPEKLEALIARHDPGGQARAVNLRSYDGTLTIGGGRGNAGIVVDVATGEKVASGPSTIANVLLTARRMHERLLIDAEWLVIASTVAMLVLIAIGMLMGLPRFANTLSGWHKGVAWVLLPLVVLSPLTGLLMSMRVGGPQGGPGGPPQAQQGQTLRLPEALRALGREHDLSGLIWLRPMRGQTLARIAEGGEYKVYAVTPAGVTLQARNWPRLWHEGNFAGHISAGLNVVTSAALVLLLVTGVWIWARRTARRRGNRPVLAT